MTSAAFENIISRDKREQFIGLRNTAFVLLVCLVALYVTGFFDAQRFIEGAPAVKQLSSEMVPPNFDRWEHWVIPLRDTLAMFWRKACSCSRTSSAAVAWRRGSS